MNTNIHNDNNTNNRNNILNEKTKQKQILKKNRISCPPQTLFLS